MSPDTTDEALLRQYVKHRSEAAFAQLVRRYHALVYATCRRELGDADLAEDAAQAVFLILAQKASSLRANNGLAGWLSQTARFAARNLLRQEQRRRQREQKLAEMAQEAPPPEDGLWERVEPALNDSLAHLSSGDREAVERRFFAGQSLAAVGAALGVSENTARMRVTRAIDRMRRHLARQGVPVTPAALAALLSEKAGEAARLAVPAGAALSHSLATASVQQLAQGVLRAMWIKTVFTTAAVSAVAGAALTVPLVAAMRHAAAQVRAASATPTSANPVNASRPDAPPANVSHAAALAAQATPTLIVKTIKFTANTPDGQPSVPADALKGMMNTKEGQPLDTGVLNKDLYRLFDRQKGYVRSKGFIVDVSPNISLDPTTGILTIPLVETHISHVIIQGNSKVPSSQILAQMQSKPGELLDENKLQADQTRIFNIGLTNPAQGGVFTQVGPWQEMSKGDGLVDIVEPVVEK